MKYKVGIAGYGIVGERRKKFIEMCNTENFSLYIYNLFRNLDNVGME